MRNKRTFLGLNLNEIMGRVSRFIKALPLEAKVDVEFNRGQWEVSIQW